MHEAVKIPELVLDDTVVLVRRRPHRSLIVTEEVRLSLAEDRLRYDITFVERSHLVAGPNADVVGASQTIGDWVGPMVRVDLSDRIVEGNASLLEELPVLALLPHRPIDKDAALPVHQAIAALPDEQYIANMLAAALVAGLTQRHPRSIAIETMALAAKLREGGPTIEELKALPQLRTIERRKPLA